MSRLANNEELWLAPTRLHSSLLHCSPFYSVQDITLSCLFLPAFTSETFQWCFEGFLQQIRRLKLDRPISCPRALVTFIASFPNLEDTTICAPSWIREASATKRDQGSRSFGNSIPHTRRFRGALYLSDLAQDSGRFLSHLATGMADFEKVAFSGCTFKDPRPLQDLISSTGACLKKLHIMLNGDREFSSANRTCAAACSPPPIGSSELPDISLSDCENLQQIMFSFCGPEAPFPAMAAILSTVKSRRFHSFILDVNVRCFTQAYRGSLLDKQMEGIRMFDLPLCRLAARQALEKNHRRASIMILADNPEPLALGLVRFHRIGNIWAGEKVRGGYYRWSFSEAEEVED